MDPILDRIRRLALVARLSLAAERSARILAWSIAALLAAILLDAAFRWPGAIRGVILAAMAAGLLAAARRSLLPGLRFRPEPVEIALRLERGRPDLRGRLASAVDFRLRGADSVDPVAAAAVREVASRLGAGASSLSLDWRRDRIARSGGMLAAGALLAASLLAAFPLEARIGLERTLAPWSSARWPARTEVADLVSIEVAPRGRPLVLSAALVKGDPEQERVEAVVQVERDGVVLPEEVLVLTRQSGRRFERRIPSDADRVTYVLRSEDHETEPRRIELVEPPEVLGATLAVEPPEYAAGDRAPQRIDLGPGTDRRASMAGAVLSGSRVVLGLDLAKPLPVPEPSAQAAWLGEVLPGLPPEAVVAVDPQDPRRWLAAWTMRSPVVLEPRLRDEHGLESTAGATYRIDAVDDAPPTVAILEPSSDESVLATAVIDLRAEARDDVAVAAASFDVARQGAAQPSLLGEGGEPGPRRGFAATLSLESIGAAAGDLVEVVAVASDRFDDGAGPRDPSRSQPRRLKVVGEGEFLRQVREDLAAMRQGAIRVDAEQARVLEGEPGAAPQASISDRLASLGEGAKAVSERLARNRLDPEGLPALLGQAEDRLDRAADASRRAEDLRRAMAEESGEASGEDLAEDPVEDPSEDAGEARQAEEPDEGQDGSAATAESLASARREVRREIQSLVELLDRDEDTWSLRREAERLSEDLARLAREVAEVAPSTVGRSPEDLPAGPREALGELARRQQELADAAEALLDQMEERSERLAGSDLAQAEALRQAAELARQEGLERSMEQASEQVAGNRLEQAAASQQQAQQALDRMRRGLEDTRRVRTETLRRLMTELEDSIEALLRASESEARLLRGLAPLGPPWDAAATGARRDAVVRLERNTRATEVAALAGGAEVAPVAEAIARAAGAQGEAIGGLSSDRGRVPEVPASLASLERSTMALREALDLARRIGEDAEQEARRQRQEELAAAYRELAGRQAMRRGEVEALDAAISRGDVPERRRVLERRRAATAQEEVTASARTLREGAAELADAAVFASSQEWIERWSESAASMIRDGSLPDAPRRQALVEEAALAMAESLEALAEEEDAFAGEESSAGGGGSGSGGGGEDEAIPPIAQLRLLRSMQDGVHRRTRALAEEPVADQAARASEVAELAAMQEAIESLAEALLEEVESKEEEPGAEPPPAPIGAPAPGAPSSSAQDPPTKADPRTKEAAPAEAGATGDEPPSLDELLGIEEEAPSDEGAAESARRVGERLRERPVADDFREAIAQMRRSTELLRDAGDVGLDAQRAQLEAIRRLDALIEGAERQRQRQRQRGNPSGSPEQQPSPPESSSSSSGEPQGSRRSGAAAEGGEAEPPPFEEAELGRLLEEGRVEWGQLPERVRELVRQGRRDRVSSIYRRLTEEYYRRLAEEAMPR